MAEVEVAEADTGEVTHLQPNALKEAPHLSLAPLLNDDLASSSPHLCNAKGSHINALNKGARFDRLKVFRAHLSGCLYKVLFLYSRRGVDDAVCKLPIICHEKQPRRLDIEPAHGEKSLIKILKEIENRLKLCPWFIRADKPLWLIEKEVALALLLMDRLPVKEHLIGIEIDKGLWDEDALAIDTHTACINELLSTSARRDASPC